jgi:predicted RNA-binding protein
MCLSTIYLERRDDDSVVMGEVARIVEDEAGVVVSTLFGEERRFEGRAVAEVSLVENYVVLRAKGSGQ